MIPPLEITPLQSLDHGALVVAFVHAERIRGPHTSTVTGRSPSTAYACRSVPRRSFRALG
jgi:hypothetical protein